MPVTCPKCDYVRKPSDTNPEWQCPSCGVAYAKADTSGTPPELVIHAGYHVEKTAPSRYWKLLWFVLAAGVAYGAQHYLPALMAGAAPALDTPAAAAGEELSEEELRGMIGEGDDARAFMAQHSDNPALETHYYKIDSGGNVGLAVRPLLTERAQAKLRELTPQRVVLFGTATCTYCAQVRRYLDGRKVAYADLDVQTDLRASEYETNVLLSTSYPVLVIGREVMYGYNPGELARAVQAL